MIYVALYEGSAIFSKLVQWQTRSTYSHAAIITPNDTIVEALEGVGVREVPITSLPNEERRKYKPFAVEGLTEDDSKRALKFARAQIGKGYDYLSVLRFVSRRKTKHNNRWFCSELVFASLRAAGVDLLARIEAGEVSPRHLSLSPYLTEHGTGIIEDALRKTKAFREWAKSR